MAIADEGTTTSVHLLKEAAHVLIPVTWQVASWVAQQFGGVVTATADSVKQAVTHGSVSIKQLQNGSVSEVHITEISGEQSKAIKKELHKYHVKYSVEQSKSDSQYYLHFAGKDMDTVNHALDEVRKSLETQIAGSEGRTTKAIDDMSVLSKAAQQQPVVQVPTDKKISAQELKQRIRKETKVALQHDGQQKKNIVPKMNKSRIR